MPEPDPPLGTILEHYGFETARTELTGAGLINRTWLVSTDDGARYILQRVNPMFPPEINLDIEAVTTHLRSRGATTPELLRTRDDRVCVTESGHTWRLMTCIEGEARTSLRTPEEAREAGRILAEFHVAAGDLEYDFHFTRPGIHDTAMHLGHLHRTLERRRGHPRYSAVEPLAREVLDEAARLPVLPALPQRIVHGDPKISNFIFETGSNRAICLVDLDCVSRMPLPLELGDAFRSWCNRAGEDARESEFSEEMFRTAAGGYADAAKGFSTATETGAFVGATRIICTELAARFCADALNEDYFGWDPERFPGHSEHSEVRAAGQLSLARSIAAQQDRLERIIAAAFSA